ncbi:MAG: TlpA family protein disulfide reductase [Thermoleophilia bacterium]|nr:TlpA family protein disulfide reductase [Thermoleophilia bacterium]
MSEAPQTPAPDADVAPSAAAPSSRWGTIAWVTCSALIVVLVAGFWLRVNDERSGTNLIGQIADNKRPMAPALPTKQITGDGAPGLPAWYRASGSQQAASVAGAQPIVLNWWASWCGPCVDEAPILREVYDDYKDRVTFVGLNAGNRDLNSDARNFVREHNFEFSIVRADKNDGDAWGVQRYPETFIIGTDGRLSAHVPGAVDDKELRALLDAELAKDRSQPASTTTKAAG